MYDLICQYLINISQVLIPCIFLRMVADIFRNNVLDLGK